MSFVSRSGSKSGRARLFEFFVTTRSITIITSARPRPSQPPLEQQDFGAVFGGPVVLPWMYNGRNKTFFFASYEAYRNKTAAAPSTATIPMPEMFGGDFSGWRDASGNLIPIYDPATTRVNPNGPGFIRDPFPGNMIPAARFSQISREVLKLATMRPDLPGVRNNFVYTSATPSARIRGTSSASSSITSVEARIAGILFHWVRCS